MSHISTLGRQRQKALGTFLTASLAESQSLMFSERFYLKKENDVSRKISCIKFWPLFVLVHTLACTFTHTQTETFKHTYTETDTHTQ